MTKKEALDFLEDVAQHEIYARWDLAQTLEEREEAAKFENKVRYAIQTLTGENRWENLL